MTRRTIFRLCVALLLPALAIASAVAPLWSGPTRVSAQANGSTVSVCGTISAYTAPGLNTTGLLTFSSPAATYTIAAAANVTLGAGAATSTGSNVCVVGLVGPGSQLSGVTITANPTTNTLVNLCGVVGTYSTSGTTTGAITIGGVFYPIAVNAVAFSGVALTSGTNVCLTATLNALSQITGGVAVANTTTVTTTAVNLCGTLSAFTPAASSAVSATIAFSTPTQSFIVTPGVTIGNTNLAQLGGLICIVGQTNGTQLTSVSFVPLSATTLTVCGVVSAYNPATSTTAGSVTINGTTIALAANATLSSAITQNTNLCLVLTLNTLQQATALAVSVNTAVTATPTATVTGTPPTATATPTPATLVVCGVITNYVAASATTNGTLTINGTVVGLAPGVLFSGVTVAVGANVCISGTLNSSTQITTAAVTQNAVTPTATTNVPPPPPPPGGAATATPTATAVPPTATAVPPTATAVPPTATPVPPQPTPTPKPAKTPKPKPTATTPAPAPGPAPQGPGPAPTPVPAPVKLPSTGFGGTGAFAHNAAVGRVFRASGNVTAPLGITPSPATGGSDPINPAIPAILGLAAIGFGVLARKVGIARR